MKAMPETQLLMLLGQSPTTGGYAEHLGDFLASHGFHDAAALVRSKFDAVYDHDSDDAWPFEPPSAPAGLMPVAFYKHKERGTIYEVYGDASLQMAAGKNVDEGDELVVYRGPDGKLWVRPTSEFHDGRFEGVEGKTPDVG